MTDNPEQNRISIDEFKQGVQQLVLNKDTLNGIHIILSSKTSYQEFIKLLDICKSSTLLSRYLVYEDDLWYIYKNDDPRIIKTEKQDIEQGIEYRKKLEKEKTNARYIELSNETFIQRIESFYLIWPWIIAFLLFGTISIRFMIKK